MEDRASSLNVARRYHRAWTGRDFAAAADCLSPGLEVDGPLDRHASKESFLRALPGFASLAREVVLLDAFAADDRAMLLYDMALPGLDTVRVAEHVTVENERISRIRRVHDAHALRKAGLAPLAARAVADTADASLLATVDLPAPPQRVFPALASGEITRWWVRPGVFDTREWSGRVEVGGAWRASGMVRGQPYALEGRFLAIDSPQALSQTWHAAGAPTEPGVVHYRLEPVGRGGTRLTLRHTGFASPEQCINTAIGWETSLDRLAALLGKADANAADRG